MIVAVNTTIFIAVLFLGIFLFGVAINWFFDGVDGFAEGFGVTFFFLAGLALLWIGGGCLYCGYNSNVHFEMKNADGKVIIKDVKPFCNVVLPLIGVSNKLYRKSTNTVANSISALENSVEDLEASLELS